MKLDPDRKANFLFAAVIAVGALLALGWYIADTTGYRVYQIPPRTRSRGSSSMRRWNSMAWTWGG